MVIAGDAYRARMVGFLCFSGKAKVWREYCWAKLKFCHANRKLNNKVFSSVAQTFEGNYRLFDFWYSNVKAVAHQAGIKELAPMKADCVVALCLGIKGALEHTAKNAINGQLACMFCICMRGNTVYTSRWHLSFRNKNRDQDCGYTNREKSSVCLPFWIWIMLINKLINFFIPDGHVIMKIFACWNAWICICKIRRAFCVWLLTLTFTCFSHFRFFTHWSAKLNCQSEWSLSPATQFNLLNRLKTNTDFNLPMVQTTPQKPGWTFQFVFA